MAAKRRGSVVSTTKPEVGSYSGYCPVCESATSFEVRGLSFRDQLVCPSCDDISVPRERALAIALRLYAPNWRELRILECSPAPRGVSSRLRTECRSYTAMNYFPDEVVGKEFEGVVNEDLQNLSFSSEAFDVFVALDVLEHIPDPAKAIAEVARVLVPNGVALLTFPVRSDVADAILPLALLRPDGLIQYLSEPEYHGNPFDGEGSLVFNHFGYDIHSWLADKSGLDCHVMRFADRTAGVLGPLTEVFVLGRRLSEGPACSG